MLTRSRVYHGYSMYGTLLGYPRCCKRTMSLVLNSGSTGSKKEGFIWAEYWGPYLGPGLVPLHIEKHTPLIGGLSASR